MSAMILWGVELELAGVGGGWTDVSDDVRGQAPITVEYGINGQTPTDRIASAGRASFALNNSEFNSATTQGYYSPYSGAKRSGFDFNGRVRIWFQRSGGTKQYKFLGRLSDINVTPGEYADRLTKVVATDIWDDLAKIDMPSSVPTQTGKRADELITSILDALNTQPTTRALGTGVSTFNVALDGAVGQTMKTREALNQIVLSEQGYLYTNGDTSSGDVFVFEERGARVGLSTFATFDDDMARDGLAVTGSRDEIYRTVSVTVHPATVSEEENIHTILWKLDQSMFVAANQTVIIRGSFSDPTTGQACGGADMVTPTLTSGDLGVNTLPDATGTDLTLGCTLSVVYSGQDGTATLTNGPTDGYIWYLSFRGKAVTRTDVTAEQTVAGSYGDQVLIIDMPYQDDGAVATSVAAFFATALSTPSSRIRQVKFLANRSATFADYAVLGEVGHRIAISETVTGFSSALFMIQRVKLELQPGGILWCTWDLVPWGLDPTWTDGGASVPLWAESARSEALQQTGVTVVAPSIIQRASVTLSDAQIKSLPSTSPFALVVAPGAGFRLKPIGITFRLDSSGGAYTNIDTGYAFLIVDCNGWWMSSGVVNDNQTPTFLGLNGLSRFLGRAHTRIYDIVPIQLDAIDGGSTAGTRSYVHNVDDDFIGQVSDLENQPLTLYVGNNGAGDFTGGHASNSLRVTVYYVVEPV